MNTKESEQDLKVLNVGGGKDESTPNALSIDKSKLASPDILHDLDLTPWPIEDNSFDVIYCKDVIEHVADIIKTMEEIHRIAKPGAKVVITTPHFSCSNSYTDPTHRHHLGFFSFDYFTGENQWDFYTAVRFEKLSAELTFFPNLKNKLIWRIAKKYPRFYEEHLCWVFPAWYMKFELKVIK